MLKILQVTFNYSPDINQEGLHQYHISKELVRKGHHVEIVALTNSNTPYKKEIDGITVHYLPKLCSFRYLPIPNKVSLSRLRTMVDEFDIIHYHHYFNPLSYFVSEIAKKKHSKSVFTTHSLYATKNIRDVLLNYLYDIVIGQKIIHNSDAIIALLPSDVGNLIKLGADARKIRVIPNGVSIKKFEHIPDPADFKRRYGLDDKVILFVGRLHKSKGVQNLLKAGVKVVQGFSNAKFLIVGPDHGYMQKLRELSVDLNLEKNVVFTGLLKGEQLLEAYSSADVFVLPSHHECFSMVLLEAAASKLPIIATKTGVAPYLIEEGKNGILVNVQDSEQLSSAILYLLSNPKIARKMGKCGKERAVKQYSLEFVVDKLEELYLDIKALTSISKSSQNI